VHYFDFIATSTHKCSIKNALAHTCSCFFTKTYLYPFFVSPYEAMGTRVRVRLKVRLSVSLRARVIEQSQVGNN